MFTWNETLCPDRLNVHAAVVERSKFSVDLITSFQRKAFNQIWKEMSQLGLQSV